MTKPSLTQEQALALFEYRDGKLFWRHCVLSNPSELTAADKRHLKYAGRKAGTGNGNGYLTTSYRDKRYYIHHLVFLMFHGYRPKLLDHINGVRDDNRIENLREVTTSQNSMNTSLRSDNVSGTKGVSWHKGAKKWTVTLQVGKVPKYMGLYEDYELACLMASEARDAYHGEFARRT
jgi:hypothetical protein